MFLFFSCKDSVNFRWLQEEPKLFVYRYASRYDNKDFQKITCTELYFLKTKILKSLEDRFKFHNFLHFW